MQASYDSVGRPALIVLHEMHLPYAGIEIPGGERLEEISPAVFKQARLYYDDTVYICLYNIHFKPVFSSSSMQCFKESIQ